MPAVTVPPSLVPVIARGAPQLHASELGGARPLADPGRPIELVDSAGGFLAWGIADPENDLVRILSREPDDGLDDAFLRRRAAAALALRERLGLIGPDRRVRSAFRLVNGEGDGLGGCLVDVYGDWAIEYVLARGLREWGRRLAEAVAACARDRGLLTGEGEPWPRGVLQKVRGKDSARPGKPVQSTVLGETPPRSFIVEENGVPFEIHPLAGLNVGLFTDMREHRWRIGRFARGARVLNLFAYTGSLSVAAALAGAREVVSVDLSSGVLKWARENFRLAGLDPGAHRFEVADVMGWLRDAKAGGERFGLVILDPPTYSAARAASWSMRKDLPDLVAASLALLRPGGVLWFSANTRQLAEAEVEKRIAEGAAAAGRELVLLEAGGLPPDHPTPLEFVEGRYLKVRVMRCG